MTRVITTTYVNTYRFDFAIEGGTTGAKVLRGPQIPSGCIVTDALIHVDAALTGGTGSHTVSLGSGESATDLQTATARNAEPWASTGAKRATFTATTAPLKMTADRAPTLTINSSALTAGRIRVVLTIMEVI